MQRRERRHAEPKESGATSIEQARPPAKVPGHEIIQTVLGERLPVRSLEPVPEPSEPRDPARPRWLMIIEPGGCGIGGDFAQHLGWQGCPRRSARRTAPAPRQSSKPLSRVKDGDTRTPSERKASSQSVRSNAPMFQRAGLASAVTSLPNPCLNLPERRLDQQLGPRDHR